MFTPFSLIPATPPTPSVLGQLPSGTNTSYVNQITGGLYGAPQQQPQPQQTPPQTQRAPTPRALTSSQMGEVNTTLPAATTPRPQATLTTPPATGGFRVGQPIAQGMPQNVVTSPAGLINRINPPMLSAFAGTRTPTPFSNEQAQELFNYGSQYASSQGAFSNLYDKFLEGDFRGESAVNALRSMQEYSRQANTAQTQYGSLLGSILPQRPPAAGMPTPASPIALQGRFTLPQETWNMNPQELANWIQNYERKMGRDSFLGNAAWIAGPALISGAAAGAITGAPGLSLGNSLISTGLENLAGNNRR